MHRRTLKVLAVVSLMAGLGVLSSTVAFGMASHENWPVIGNHKGHPNNESGTMVGIKGVHNELLGGDGNDTIEAGNDGDVIWGDSHEDGGHQTEHQTDHLIGGAGKDFLYASHGTNYISTGAGNDWVYLTYGHGVLRCNGSGHKRIYVPFLSENLHYQLIGCNDKTLVPTKV